MILYFQSLTKENSLIKQDIFHAIVTAAIDFINIQSEKYKQINANIKLGNTVIIYYLYLANNT